ncbi:hypothetical protein [Streptomyces sp. ST2-7A]|uniref:hypothetical protein n=1 Tax=Streptomyces sp. ST2-7A TaxID=2907214 RepID=UPI001F346E1C|nr:hypothetical protein [Streptomyces sp. ST2-7A]
MAIARRLAVVTLGIGVLLGSAPAFAITSTTTGSKAYTSKSGAGVTDGRANVEDTSADSRAAYGQYERKSAPGEVRTLWNKSGAGTTVYSDGAQVYKIRACRQEQWGPDSCGNWAA